MARRTKKKRRSICFYHVPASHWLQGSNKQPGRHENNASHGALHQLHRRERQRHAESRLPTPHLCTMLYTTPAAASLDLAPDPSGDFLQRTPAIRSSWALAGARARLGHLYMRSSSLSSGSSSSKYFLRLMVTFVFFSICELTCRAGVVTGHDMPSTEPSAFPREQRHPRGPEREHAPQQTHGKPHDVKIHSSGKTSKLLCPKVTFRAHGCTILQESQDFSTCFQISTCFPKPHQFPGSIEERANSIPIFPKNLRISHEIFQEFPKSPEIFPRISQVPPDTVLKTANKLVLRVASY